MTRMIATELLDRTLGRPSVMLMEMLMPFEVISEIRQARQASSSLCWTPEEPMDCNTLSMAWMSFLLSGAQARRVGPLPFEKS